MHELALSHSLIDIVLDHAGRHGLRRVTEVRLAVGALSCVEPRALAFCFEAVSLGTPAEGAELSIDTVPVEAWCWTCERTVEVADRDGGCSACGHATVRAADPTDLRVTEIVGDGDEAPPVRDQSADTVL